MRKVLLGLALACMALVSCVGQVSAQTSPTLAYVVSTCGGLTLPLNEPRLPYMDQNGRWCTSAFNSSAPGSQEQDVRSSATINAATLNASITIPVNGQGTVGFTFTGLTASGGAVLTYEQSIDGGTTWTGVNEVNSGTGIFAATRVADGQVRVSAAGRTNLRIRVTTVGTGTISVVWTVSVREGLVTLASPLPPGTNFMGGAYVGSTSVASGPTPTVARGTASLVARTTASNLYGFSFTQGATAGFLAILDAAAAPAASAAITPIECIPVAANTGLRARHDLPDRYSTGVVVLSTSSCTTYTAVTPLLMSVVAQ